MQFSIPDGKQLEDFTRHRNLEVHLHNLISHYHSRVTLLLTTEKKGRGAGETRRLGEIAMENEGQAP